VNFVQNSDNDIAYIWDFGDGTPVGNLPNATHIYETAGQFNVSLTVLGIGGCASVFSGEMVVALDTPHVSFTSDPEFPVELPLPETSVQFTNNSIGIVSQTWDFGDGIFSPDLHPSHVFSTEGTYFVTLVAENAEGCYGHASGGPFVVILPDLFIPNVFSPNGDGINDVFFVDYTGSQPFQLDIFDRWGVLLYQGTNKTIGWDGNTTQGQPATDGVYFYHVEIGGRAFVGEVTMMR
jgi:gliding motility-associated-like protein